MISLSRFSDLGFVSDGPEALVQMVDGTSRAQQNVRRQMFRFSSEKIKNRSGASIRCSHDMGQFFSGGFIHILQGFGVDIPTAFREKVEQFSFSR